MSASHPRVLIDATAVPPDRRGVGRYVDCLLPQLDLLGTPLLIACRSEDVGHYESLCPNADILPGPAQIGRRPVRLAWEQTGLARMVAKSNAHVVHSPHYTQPLAVRRPTVVTLHDATFFTHPEVHERVKALFFTTWTKISLRRAARCIVPSAATRDELVRVAGAKTDRIDVVHLGVDETVFHQPTADEITAARALLTLPDRPYIAFLGTLEPRKNIPNLIRGFTAAVRERADKPVLVLAGGAGWDESLDELITGLPDGVDVLRPGFLPLELLRGYLGGAEFVAYPSLGEGFGLPVLEAMACAAPVLTTPLLSLSEVGGAAVEYTETDAESIGASITQLLDNPVRRSDLSRLGLQRARQFSWRAAAEKHQEIYLQLAGQNR